MEKKLCHTLQWSDTRDLLHLYMILLKTRNKQLYESAVGNIASKLLSSTIKTMKGHMHLDSN